MVLVGIALFIFVMMCFALWDYHVSWRAANELNERYLKRISTLEEELSTERMKRTDGEDNFDEWFRDLAYQWEEVDLAMSKFNRFMQEEQNG